MKSTLLLLSVLFTSLLTAQRIDMPTVGSGYMDEAYVNLETGEVTVQSADSWDIAFSAAGLQDAGIFINEAAPLMGTALELYDTGISTWEDVPSDPSFLEEEPLLLNPDENWTTGAFNTMADPQNPIDYGWGAYNGQTRTVEGNRIFAIKKRDGSWIKLQIINLAFTTYNFRYADLDGSNEVSASVNKDDANGTPWIHFSFETGTSALAPEGWDVLFTRYSEPLDDGEGGILDYTLTGVFTAPGVESVMADGVDPGDVNESDYQSSYSSDINNIGHDWKFFDFMSGWIIDQDRAYFVKRADGQTFKLIFLDFEGSRTGTTTIETTDLGVITSNDELVSEPTESIFSYPNPVKDELFLNIPNATGTEFITLRNTNGQILLKQEVYSDQSIYLSSLLNEGLMVLNVYRGGSLVHTEYISKN